MTTCVYCGAELENGAAECKHCGRSISNNSQFAGPGSASASGKRSRRSPGTTLLSILVCILILAVMLPTFLMLTASNALTRETFLAVLRKTDLNAIPASILDETDPTLDNIYLAEFICQEINQVANENLPTQMQINLTPKLLNAVKRESTLYPFIAEHLESLFHAFVDGKRAYRIQGTEIEKLLNDNSTFLEEKIGLPLDLFELEITAEYILSTTKLHEIPLDQSWRADNPQFVPLVKALISGALLFIPLSILAFLVILLFFVNRDNMRFAIKDVGVICILGAVPALLCTIGANAAALYYAGKDTAMYLGSVIISCILNRDLFFLVPLFLGGIVLLPISRKFRGKK